MKTQEAKELGGRVAALAQANQLVQAYTLLAPVLAARTPFAMLDHIGAPVGMGDLSPANAFMEHIAAAKTEGGWVVIASALRKQLGRDPAGSLERCRQFIIAADVWYATDILGERVPGPALVDAFEATLKLIAPWRIDDNRWVRRTVGVAVHFWAKRSRGELELAHRAKKLLDFLEPMFTEQETDAIKGVGWGLKTLGRYYPILTADWLEEQIVCLKQPCRALMLNKALTFLPAKQRARIIKSNITRGKARHLYDPKSVQMSQV